MFAVKSQPEEVFGLPNIKSAKKRVQLRFARAAREQAQRRKQRKNFLFHAVFLIRALLSCAPVAAPSGLS